MSLSPLYLQRDDPAQGLGRVLRRAGRGLARVEFGGRRRRATAGQSWAGRRPGQPRVRTKRPTSERLLAGRRGRTLTIFEQAGAVRYHVTPLPDLQRQILALAGVSASIYAKLAAGSTEPP